MKKLVYLEENFHEIEEKEEPKNEIESEVGFSELSRKTSGQKEKDRTNKFLEKFEIQRGTDITLVYDEVVVTMLADIL